ncbi:hypothetical protein Vi05172_g11668 [Venturia inaequalis]|nr:hypothetical protein Vi05172_g11668 [Venturia inaequalis]
MQLTLFVTAIFVALAASAAVDLSCDSAYCACVKPIDADRKACFNGHCSIAFPDHSPPVPNC